MTTRTILFVTLLIVGSALAVPALAEDPDLNAYAPGRTLEAGAETAITVQLVNTADHGGRQNEVARAVRATLESGDAPLTVKSGTTAVPEIPNGGMSQAEFQIEVDSDAEPGIYELPVEVRYTHDDTTRTRTLSVTVEIEGQAQFEVQNTESDLSVGDDGTVTFTVENVGHEIANDAVVRYTGESQNLHFEETEYALSELQPGESKNVSYSVEVSTDSGDGPRRLPFVVEYENSAKETVESSPMYAHVNVSEKRELFGVTPQDTRVTAGSGKAITFEVTNRGEDTVRDINAKLFVNAPLSSSDDEGYISELPPGESATVTFQVAAGASALEKPYPVSVDFQYDTENGETKLSDTYRLPIEVTKPEESDLPVTSIAAGLVVLALAASLGWTWRRRH